LGQTPVPFVVWIPKDVGVGTLRSEAEFTLVRGEFALFKFRGRFGTRINTTVLLWYK